MAWQTMAKQASGKPTNPNFKLDWKYIQNKYADDGEIISKGKAKKILRELNLGEKWLNDLYSVNVVPTKAFGSDILEFVIARRDQSHIHDWRHFQQIKNDIAGEEAEGIEMYPAESRLLDHANTFWLYVFPAELIKKHGHLPIGLQGGRNVNEIGNLDPTKGAIQRPYDDSSNWS